MRTQLIAVSIALGLAGSAFAAPAHAKGGNDNKPTFTQIFGGNNHGIGGFFQKVKNKVEGKKGQTLTCSA